MVYYAGKLFGVINVNERAKNRDEVGVEGHKEAWQAKIFFTLVELTTQFWMIPIPWIQIYGDFLPLHGGGIYQLIVR